MSEYCKRNSAFESSFLCPKKVMRCQRVSKPLHTRAQKASEICFQADNEETTDRIITRRNPNLSGDGVNEQEDTSQASI